MQFDELGPDEIPLFDAMKEIIGDWSPEQKQIMGSVLLLLMACAEGDRLNMDKVAELASELGRGDLKSSEGRN